MRCGAASFAKGLCHDQAGPLTAEMLAANQYGVALPGGADLLIHTRAVIEAALEDDMALVDLDMENAFPSVTWAAIDSAVAELAPALLPWTRWCHRGPVRVWLPSGQAYYVDRGIEQGDPLGPAYCGLVMGRIARDARITAGGPLVDLWYLDDGQLVLPAHRVGAYLRAFDARAALDGMQRSRGERADIKSEVRLPGRSAAEAATMFNDAYVGDSCTIADWGAAHKVLGAMLGSREAAVAHFEERAAKADELRKAIAEIGDPATELVLLRLCADVAKVTHLLRAGTVSVDEPALAEFDRAVTRALSRCLGGDIGHLAAVQASCSVHAMEGRLRAADLGCGAVLTRRSRRLSARVWRRSPRWRAFWLRQNARG